MPLLPLGDELGESRDALNAGSDCGGDLGLDGRAAGEVRLAGALGAKIMGLQDKDPVIRLVSRRHSVAHEPLGLAQGTGAAPPRFNPMI